MFAKFSTLVPTLLSRFKASDPPPTQSNAASVRDASDLVTLSLISHTNAGKTTLARTLLRKDVGEVRDAPHVTLFNESHLLLETGGFMLRLWDTPGFGDSARLMKRLKRERNPVLWFLSQTWDRITDRPLWCSQQALKNVREEADVVLYLVNAAEPPEAAGYIGPEMEILGWVGKPVVVLLNQTGTPGSSEFEAAEINAWRAQFAAAGCLRPLLGAGGQAHGIARAADGRLENPDFLADQTRLDAAQHRGLPQLRPSHRRTAHRRIAGRCGSARRDVAGARGLAARGLEPRIQRCAAKTRLTTR
jgi:hypothetical protein